MKCGLSPKPHLSTRLCRYSHWVCIQFCVRVPRCVARVFSFILWSVQRSFGVVACSCVRVRLCVRLFVSVCGLLGVRAWARLCAFVCCVLCCALLFVCVCVRLCVYLLRPCASVCVLRLCAFVLVCVYVRPLLSPLSLVAEQK